MKKEAGIAQIFVVLIILVGLTTGVYLVQQRTNSFPKASILKPSIAQLPSSPTIADASTASYNLGVGYFQWGSLVGSDLAWSRIKDIAHIAYIQRHWQESQNPGNKSFYDSIAEEVRLARSKGLKIYLAFEILSTDRTQVELPKKLSGDFSNPRVQNAYLKEVRQAASDFQPDFFILNVEVNRYKKYNQADYDNYRSTLYPKAYKTVKSTSPKTQVAVSFSYEDYDGKNCFDSGDRDILRGNMSDFTDATKTVDMLAVSVYPFCYFDPAVIPFEFLNEVAGISSKPLFIAETGWVSQSFALTPSYTFVSSAQIQASYIDRLRELVEYTKQQGRMITAINYVSLIDLPENVCQLLKTKYPGLEWYCSLAILDKDGNPKPAYHKMGDWKAKLF